MNIKPLKDKNNHEQKFFPNSDRLGGRSIEVDLNTPNPRPSTLGWLLTKDYFIMPLQKYLWKRNADSPFVDARDIKSLRLTCKAIREAIARYLHHLVKINPQQENILTYLAEHEKVLSFPGDLCLQLVVANAEQLVQLLNAVQNSQELKEYAASVSIQSVDASEAADLNSLMKHLPLNIVNFKFGGIKSGIILDLSSFQDLEELEVGGEGIYGKLIVSSTIKNFQGGGCVIFLDLSHCPQLSSVKFFAIWGEIKLPENIVRFECMSMPSRDLLDLSHCSRLVAIKVGLFTEELYSSFKFNENEKLKLPASVKCFEHGDINSHACLDLTSYPHLQAVKVGRIDGKFARLKLPVGIEYFECLDIVKMGYREVDYESRSEAVLDLSGYVNIKRAKMRDVGGNVALPPNIEGFECQDVRSDFFQLKGCNKLETVRVRNIHTGFFLELLHLKEFTCKDCQGGLFHIIDLSKCPNLTTVEMGVIGCNVMLPANIIHFKCKNIDYNELSRKAWLDLSIYSHLETVSIEKAGKGIRVPASITSFACRAIRSEAVLDLSHCFDLNSLRIGQLRGKLILSHQYHRSLIRISHPNIKWVD